MSKTNRRRRREKQIRRAKARRVGGPAQARRVSPGDAIPRELIREMIVGAAGALHGRDPAVYNEVVGTLAEVPVDSDDGRAFDEEMATCFASAIALAWGRGWQPADVARLAARRLGAAQATLTVDAVAADRRLNYGAALSPRWRAQLDELAAEVWWHPDRSHLAQWTEREALSRQEALGCALEVLSLLWDLPTLPRLGPLPGEQSAPRRSTRDRARSVDTRVLGRVRSLLAKAESTTFPEEAEALSAKAQELMARHMIDRVMLDEAAGTSTSEHPMGVRVSIDDPYAGAKSALLSGVALANRCRAVWSANLGFSTVFGHEVDIETVELLFSSLLVQATRAMVAAGRQIDWAGRSRTRSYRQSFLVAYATRITTRLKNANDAMVAEATAGTTLLPVLASREAAVEGAIADAFPGMTRHEVSVSNGAGWAAGTLAADLASLSIRSEVRAR